MTVFDVLASSHDTVGRRSRRKKCAGRRTQNERSFCNSIFLLTSAHEIMRKCRLSLLRPAWPRAQEAAVLLRRLFLSRRNTARRRPSLSRATCRIVALRDVQIARWRHSQAEPEHRRPPLIDSVRSVMIGGIFPGGVGSPGRRSKRHAIFWRVWPSRRVAPTRFAPARKGNRQHLNTETP
jgi:hypothetical protein